MRKPIILPEAGYVIADFRERKFLSSKRKGRLLMTGSVKSATKWRSRTQVRRYLLQIKDTEPWRDLMALSIPGARALEEIRRREERERDCAEHG